MAPGRLLSLAFGPAIAVALVAPAWAQTTRAQSQNQNASADGQDKPDSDNSRKDSEDADSRDRERPRAPWDDPAMQLRRLRDQVSTVEIGGDSGRGGRGGWGRRGGGDGIQSVLMRNSALQDAIGMTEEQKKTLDTINDTARQQRRDLYRAMRDNNSRGGPGGGFGGRGPGGGFDPAMMQRMRQMSASQAQQQQSALSRILSKKQQTRLNQIRLQILGPLGVAETDVAKALLLTTDQYAQIRQIIQAMEAQRQEMRRAAFTQMRGGTAPGRPTANQTRGNRTAGGGTRTQTASTKNNDDDDDDDNRRGRFDPNSPEFKAMQDRMKKMADDDAALEKKAISAIAKILTPKQKSAFNKMLGERFDLAKLVEDRGGRGRRGG